MYEKIESQNSLGPRLITLPYWLEDCTNYFVQLILNPVGVGFPNYQDPITVINCSRDSIQINNLGKFLVENKELNIWRSWKLFSDDGLHNMVGYVPFLIDIDNWKNIKDAHYLTLICLDFFEKKREFQNFDCLRVIFSGQKGFHIEARPIESIDNQQIRKRIIIGLQEIRLKGKSCNEFLYGTIDPVANFVRVTGSYNSWIENSRIIKRKVIQYTFEEFKQLSIEEIIARSEE